MVSIKKDSRKKKLVIYLCAAIVAVVIISLLILGISDAVNSSVFAERRELLGRLTESSAMVINDNIEFGQTVLNMIADNAVQNMEDYGNVYDYIDSVKNINSYKDLTFFFVDSNGKYYSSDGVYGKIVDTTYYTSGSKDSLSYISSLPHLGPQKAYLIFRNRLPEALHVTTHSGEADLLYCAYLYDIDELNETISKEFAGDNNTFIYEDKTGVMLYKDFGIEQLIEGFNIYPKFSQCSIVYGGSPEEIEAACRNEETVVVALEIDDKEYYFSSATIAPKGWSIAFIVQSEYLDSVADNAFTKIVSYVALVAVVLGVLLIVIVAAFYKSRLDARSIAEITSLNTELESATRAKSDFLSNMSHDIRTPINGIMGMTEIAKKVDGNPQKTLECLNKIEGSAHHLLSLVNDVLDMTRIERGKIEIVSKPIDIRTILDNCFSIIKGQTNGKNLNLISEINCKHTYLFGDDLHLRQILINILGNAVKFTPDGGTIWMRCNELESTEDEVTLSFEIEDTGIGMSAEFLPTIFDAFTQDKAGANSPFVGTGLGMAITKQFTELMGGKIDVESQEGKGSKFTVVIPFKINTNPEKEEKTDIAQNIQGVRLLVVEDNALNMEIVVELLSDAGAVITQAENGQRAVDIFTQNPPDTFDAILMDIMMPVMNGLDATRAIRALQRDDARHIPIIAMTANAFENDIQETRNAGMNAHLSKPIVIGDVIKTIAYFTRKQ